MPSFLSQIQESLNPDWILVGSDRLQLREDAEGQVISIRSGGVPYLLFQLDKPGYNIFPFFSKLEGMMKRSDYLLFAENKGTVFVFAVELKSRRESRAWPQIKASKLFSRFLMERIKEVQKIPLRAEYRGIACIPGGITPTNVKYNEGNTVNCGKTLELKRFLK